LIGTPSQWVVEHAPLIRKGGRVLDLACGSGRHAIWLAGQGYQVDAIDRDAQALAGLQGRPHIHAHITDLETGSWPADDAYYAENYHSIYDAIIVSRYLFRPLLNTLAAMLAPGGVLIYETFMLGNERYGRPSNPDFLLMPDELKSVYATLLKVCAFEQGKVEEPVPAMMQRICAIKSA
jgi:SAM-dependent methyltransferase